MKKQSNGQMLPEVQEYLDAQERVNAFRAQHYDLFAQYAALLEQRDAALENADKAVKSSGQVCGPWRIHSQSVQYDAEKFYEEVGREDFLRFGGEITTRVVYAIDRARVEATIAKGDLPEEVVSAFRTVKTSYSGPKKSNVP